MNVATFKHSRALITFGNGNLPLRMSMRSVGD